MRESGKPPERRRRVPLGAIGLVLALAVSVAGVAWAAGLDETGVEVAPSSGDSGGAAATPAPPRPAAPAGP
ncbi:hypothetical protein [Streptomyces lunalinharesii]|uniref:Uncharacterized protein n=1 Tax=Streptomyces lunalinharesii TaxID=333384 RepID=A0ABP6DUM9_9ACTN